MEPPQNIDWTAARNAAISCVKATWGLVCWAGWSQDADYNTERATIHLTQIDQARVTFKHALFTLHQPDLLDSIAVASVGEGPKPDFQYRTVSCATAHEASVELLRRMLLLLENAVDELHYPSLDQLHDLSVEDLRDCLVLVSRMHLPIDILYAGETHQIRTWIKREWAAACRTQQTGDADPYKQDVVRSTTDGLSGRSLRFFTFLVGKTHKTYFEELRDDSIVFTKAKITDSGIETGIKGLILDLGKITAPYFVEWSKRDKWVKLVAKRASSQGLD